MSRAIPATATLERPVKVKLRPQKPLVDTTGVEHLVMSTHAIERCEERGIGILEVYSALAEPDYTNTSRSNGEPAVNFIRGDVKVPVSGNTIVTVVDLNEDHRTEPRQPLNPIIDKGKRMARRTTTLDEAWIFLKHTEPDVRLISITPELADKILGFNTENRRMRGFAAKDYAATMTEGGWKLTHQGIALDTNGIVQDGQHRLQGIVDSGTTQQFFIFVGMDPAAYTALDIGMKRTYGDTMTRVGHNNAAQLGSCARLVFLFQRRDFTSTWKVTNQQVLDTVSEDEDGFVMAMTWGGRLKKPPIGLAVHVGAAAFYLISRANSAERVNQFFQGLIDMEFEHGRSDPRNVLVRALSNLSGTSRTGPEKLALVIKAWNAWEEGRTISVLSWRRNEEMPKVTRSALPVGRKAKAAAK